MRTLMLEIRDKATFIPAIAVDMSPGSNDAALDRRDDLADAMSPVWMQVITDWKGRGGIRSKIVATHGKLPDAWVAKLDA